jgi:hypothetical protein
MWRCVDLWLTDVSEERIASIFRVEKSASVEPAVAGGCRLRHILEDNILHSHRCESLKSYTICIKFDFRFSYRRLWTTLPSGLQHHAVRYTDVSEEHTDITFRNKTQDKHEQPLLATCFLLGSLFGPEDGRIAFFWNVGEFLQDYKAFHSRRQYSSTSKLTPRGWVLLEKLPVAQLLKDFPKFYETRTFIIVFTRALH